MSSHAVSPIAVNGLTTAINAAVTVAVGAISIGTLGGTTLMISVGIIAVQPVYIMFGGPNKDASLTASTGWRLPGGFVGRIDAPPGATHLYHLRASATTDSDISVMGAVGGI